MLAPKFLEARFEQERHRLIEADRAFLAVGEARDTAASHEGRAIGLLRRDQPCRSMADGGDDLAFAVEAFDQAGQFVAAGVIEHGAVAAGQEQRVVAGGIDACEYRGAGNLGLQGLVFQIALDRSIVLAVSVDAALVDGDGAALDRSQRHLGARIAERVVRGGEFLEPDTRRFGAGSHAVGGGGYHENAGHRQLSFSIDVGDTSKRNRRSRTRHKDSGESFQQLAAIVHSIVPFGGLDRQGTAS